MNDAQKWVISYIYPTLTALVEIYCSGLFLHVSFKLVFP